MLRRPSSSLLVALGFLVAVHAAPAAAQDLLVDGTTVTLGGEVTYDSVQVINGGQINVATYDGDASTTGILHIVADSIYVDASSEINGTSDGYQSTVDTGVSHWAPGFAQAGGTTTRGTRTLSS